MIPISLADLATIVGGVLHPSTAGAVTVDGDVVTDSRAAVRGSLYVARVGEHADGHDYIADAARRGAVAALVSRPTGTLPVVVVEDVQEAFAALARHLVDHGSPGLFVVGITGSSGKTSTKDLLGSVLRSVGPTVAPEGSLNSEVGVPLTVCRITPATRHLVVEMGARGIGHVRYLTRIAPPRVGVVLNVGSAHVGEFGSVAAIAQAKAELVEALPGDGLAVLNADDPAVADMAQRAQARVVLVGESQNATVRATDIHLDDRGRANFRVEVAREVVQVRLGLVGRHHVGNALAVLAVALEAGMSVRSAVQALEVAKPISRWRMEVTDRPDGVTVVNDAYNANPESTRAAVLAVEAMSRGRRSWAVLGAMLELGEQSPRAHEEVGASVVAARVEELVVVGEGAAGIADGARAALRAPGALGVSTRVRQVEDADSARSLLMAELRPGDVVLFKSSRDAGLRWLGEAVAAEGAN